MTTDADYGDNATIDYEIVSGPSERSGRYFDIDSQGRITSRVSVSVSVCVCVTSILETTIFHRYIYVRSYSCAYAPFACPQSK